jgi:lipopolysaccharide transport system permease protein
MTGIIDAFRWSILRGRTALDPTSVVLSVVVTSIFLCVGVWYFRRTERSFADVI